MPTELRYPVTLTVNGRELRREVEARVLLLDLLRDDLGITSARAGCETSSCGACTVILDGRAVKSCTRLAVQADGSSVLTVEGLRHGEALDPLEDAFLAQSAVGCGFCVPATIVAARDLLRAAPEPSREDIVRGLEGILCRCTGHRRRVEAIAGAVPSLRGEEESG